MVIDKDINNDNIEYITNILRENNYNLLHFKEMKEDFKALCDKDGNLIAIVSILFGKKSGIVNELFILPEYRNTIYFKYIMFYIFREFQIRNIKLNLFQVNIDDIRSINFHTKRGAKATGYKINFISYIKKYVEKI